MRPQVANDDQSLDPGVIALAALLRLHGLSVSLGEIRRQCGKATIAVSDMLRCSRALGLKPRECKCDWPYLSRAGLPGIAVLRTGGFLLLGELAEEQIVVADPITRQGKWLSRAQFETIWDGHLVLVDRHESWWRSALAFHRAPNLFASLSPLLLIIPNLDYLSHVLLDKLSYLFARIPSLDKAGSKLINTALIILSFLDRAWHAGVRVIRSDEFDAQRLDHLRDDDSADDPSVLIALDILLRYNGVAVDIEQIRYQLGARQISLTELLRFAKKMGVKARACRQLRYFTMADS
jgi:subfamily B ATP-binding cassette protein HlyB/CyaB